MFREDPFSGHVVIRSTDGNTAGSEYRLWTTVKAPAGFSIDEHCQLLAGRVGAKHHPNDGLSQTPKPRPHCTGAAPYGKLTPCTAA